MSSLEAAATEADNGLVYVYGVARSEPAALPGEGIISGAPVRCLAAGNLVALLSPVPASQFGADELHAALMNAAWLRDRVLAHEQILEQIRSQCALVPFRFGAIYRGLSRVSDILEQNQSDLNEALDRVCDASEWAVKLFSDPDVVQHHVAATSNAIGQMRKALAKATPGTRFFLQKKLDQALAAEAAAVITRRVENSRRRLDALARESASIAVQARVVHGKPADMVWNTAFLVDDEALDEFRLALAALKEGSAAHGFSYELTGPWPPYHFATRVREGMTDAASFRQQG